MGYGCVLHRHVWLFMFNVESKKMTCVCSKVEYFFKKNIVVAHVCAKKVERRERRACLDQVVD